MAWFGQEQHRSFFQVCFDDGFSNEMRYRAGCSEALVSEEVWNPADCFELFNRFRYSLLDYRFWMVHSSDLYVETVAQEVVGRESVAQIAQRADFYVFDMDSLNLFR